jgi:hypothetical protein
MAKWDKQLAFMTEFRYVLDSYLRLRIRLHEINREAEEMSFHSYGRQERIKTEVQQIMGKYEPARTQVARRMSEAIDIMNALGQKTVSTSHR